MDFSTLVVKVRQQNNAKALPDSVLALDPGETTGWAFFAKVSISPLTVDLLDCGQLLTKEKGVGEIEKLLDRLEPRVVVAEDYKVYRWKLKQHSWSDLYTPRLIGAIETLCSQRQIPLYMQMAQTAKGFCTDDKLRLWGFYKPSMKHARDAIRHGCYWLIFSR